MNISKTKIDILQGEREINNTKLAELSGISRQNISTIKLRGTCSPVNAAKIAKGLNVPVSDILESEV